ncbi:MAG: DUF1330 domain-containing protein [Pseudomonadales bacterium]|jgi:uncharacterized protein (DUF1330 family)
MSAYLVTYYKITNPDAFHNYTAAVGKTILSHGGEILVAGPGSVAKEGSPDPITVVLKFSSMDALNGWYDSPEYQEIIKLRTDNSEGSMIFAEGFVMPG